MFPPQKFARLGGNDHVLRALQLPREALTKLGVPSKPTAAERVYKDGRSTQIPVNPIAPLRPRYSICLPRS